MEEDEDEEEDEEEEEEEEEDEKEEGCGEADVGEGCGDDGVRVPLVGIPDFLLLPLFIPLDDDDDEGWG